MPREILGEPSHVKRAEPGDLIVMTGGRIGKDGIHGATFSSEELREDSPVTAVQIGDPITQKKMTDFLLLARDRGLYQFDHGQRCRWTFLLCRRNGEGDRMRAPSRSSSSQVPRPSSLGDPSLRSPGEDDPGRLALEDRCLSSAGQEDGCGGHRPRDLHGYEEIPCPLSGKDRRLPRHGLSPLRAPQDGTSGQVEKADSRRARFSGTSRI